MSDPRQRFAAAVDRPEHEIDLAEAALLVAAEEYPELDVDAYLARIDALAAEVEPRLAADATLAERVATFNDFLFREHGFVGNQERYDDPRNSFLNDVIDSGQGLPITLSILYMEVGRRVGLPVHGVGFPGHFLAKLDGDPEIVVDAFFGRIVTREECSERLRAVLGDDADLSPGDHLRPATRREILVRLLTNLKHVYVRDSDWLRAVACSDRLLVLMPDSPSELRDRGLVYERMDCFMAAVSDFERLLELVPDADHTALRARIEILRSRTGQIH